MKKTILHVTHGITVGGMETFIRDICNTNTKFNHVITAFPDKTKDIGLNSSVKVIELSSLNDIKGVYEEYNCSLIHIHFTGAEVFNSHLEAVLQGDSFFVQKRRDTVAEIKDTRNTLDNNSHGYLYIYQLWNGEELPPIIITCHAESKIPPTVQKPFIKHVISVTEKAQYSQSNLNAEQSVIYNGVDTERFKPRTRLTNNEKIIVTWTGRLSKIHLPVIAEILKDDHLMDTCEFRFAGLGKEVLSGDFHLPNNFFLLGDIDNVPELLNDTDIFLYPTTIDSFGLSIAEAMATGVPVVGSEVVAEVIGNAGFVCKNPSEYVTILKTLVGNRLVRESYGAKARQRVMNKFSLSEMITKYNILYVTLTNGKQKS